MNSVDCSVEEQSSNSVIGQKQHFSGTSMDTVENCYMLMLPNVHHFYAPQLYASVCLSVWGDTIRWRTKPRWDRDSRSSPYGSLEYL